MFLVLGSLLYMYGYVNDRMDFLITSQNWMIKLPKAYIFYAGLGIFALFNLTINAAINMYKSAEGINKNSFLFRDFEHKQRMLFWIISLQAGINLLISCMIIYMALIRINEVSNKMEYIYIPTFGLVVLSGILVGILLTVFKK